MFIRAAPSRDLGFAAQDQQSHGGEQRDRKTSRFWNLGNLKVKSVFGIRACFLKPERVGSRCQRRRKTSTTKVGESQIVKHIVSELRSRIPTDQRIA